MGTRHLIIAVKDGQTKLAQYGQWDGYPSGQGVEVLRFIKSKQRRAQLAKALDRVEFLSQAQLDKVYRSIGVTGDFMNNEQVGKFNQKLPLLSRDHGAKILSLLVGTKKPQLVNDEEFAGDSLFCEWAYVIDFDKQVFEVYKGFNEIELDSTARFANTKRDQDSEYYPIRMIAEWQFDDLPTQTEFFAGLADRS